jgi:hypothetical protein
MRVRSVIPGQYGAGEVIVWDCASIRRTKAAMV